jgi:hypothetical protein
MRPTSRQSLKSRTLGTTSCLLLAALAGCGQASAPADNGPPSSSLEAKVGGDRLWTLVRAARINPRCGAFYANSASEPESLAGACGAFTDRALRWLQANGVDAQREDIERLEFWEWYETQAESILACKRAARAAPDGSLLDHQRAAARCDPYERATRVDSQSLEAAGFVRPAGHP